MAKIPLDIDKEASVVVIKTLVKGKKGSRFVKLVLDTGASITTIPTEVALAIGCDPSKPEKRIEMITASGVEYVPVINIPRMEFLGFKLVKIEAACLNLPPKALVSGLLGLNVLKRFNIKLLFRKKELEFGDCG